MTKLAVFDWECLDSDNIQKLKSYQNDGWNVILIGNGLDCRSFEIDVSDCRKGMFFGSDEREIYSVTVKTQNTYLVFTDGSSLVCDHDDDQKVWIQDNSRQVEIAKMQALLEKLDLKLGLLCTDSGFSAYFVRPFKQLYGTYYTTTSDAEGKGLNFRLPNDGMIQLAKRSFNYKETHTVYIKIFWFYREWQERTGDQFVFIGK